MKNTKLELELIKTLKEIRSALIDSGHYTTTSVFILGIDLQIEKAEL